MLEADADADGLAATLISGASLPPTPPQRFHDDRIDDGEVDSNRSKLMSVDARAREPPVGMLPWLLLECATGSMSSDENTSESSSGDERSSLRIWRYEASRAPVGTRVGESTQAGGVTA